MVSGSDLVLTGGDLGQPLATSPCLASATPLLFCVSGVGLSTLLGVLLPLLLSSREEEGAADPPLPILALLMNCCHPMIPSCLPACLLEVLKPSRLGKERGYVYSIQAKAQPFPF